LHAADTIVAGADFGDASAIGVLCDSAPGVLAELARLGARFDRDESGSLALTREGGHLTRRVAHADGDATGAEVGRALVTAVRRSAIDVHEHTTVRDLLTVETGRRRVVTGVVLAADGREWTVSARAVVLATGGAGGLFTRTTNPPDVRGSGLGLALRAGASLVDLEFVQFHPTALDVGRSAGQLPLITEALRGEGAVLRDDSGRAVMAECHPLADLAPRDVVARRIDGVISDGSTVHLDARQVPDLARRFPTVVSTCHRHGIDPAVEPIPVVPTQHFMCGGVRTDSWGATDVTGLYAVGEVASTGVHGANRLASNSLVEGLVFGRRVAAQLALDLPSVSVASGSVASPRPNVDADAVPEIRRQLSTAAGIRRTSNDLDLASRELAALPGRSARPASTGEAGDEWLGAMAILTAADERHESRGCHWRDDHPAASEWWRQHRVVIRLDATGLPVAHTEHVDELSALERTG
jgi:L-aspartate oxidase